MSYFQYELSYSDQQVRPAIVILFKCTENRFKKEVGTVDTCVHDVYYGNSKISSQTTEMSTLLFTRQLLYGDSVYIRST